MPELNLCGIAGIYNFVTRETINFDILQCTSRRIAHRGPDDSETFMDNHIGFLHRRLSTIDLSAAGHPSMKNLDHMLKNIGLRGTVNHLAKRNSHT